jgi:hypothetical protein
VEFSIFVAISLNCIQSARETKYAAKYAAKYADRCSALHYNYITITLQLHYRQLYPIAGSLSIAVQEIKLISV